MHRNARAAGTAIVLFFAIGAMLLLRCDPMLETENISGVVLLVEAEGLKSFDNGALESRVVVVTADSVKVRLVLPRPVPVAGNIIPLVVEHYKSGRAVYYLDRQKWLMDGPGKSR